jgi:hypothetical protein
VTGLCTSPPSHGTTMDLGASPRVVPSHRSQVAVEPLWAHRSPTDSRRPCHPIFPWFLPDLFFRLRLPHCDSLISSGRWWGHMLLQIDSPSACRPDSMMHFASETPRDASCPCRQSALPLWRGSVLRGTCRGRDETSLVWRTIRVLQLPTTPLPSSSFCDPIVNLWRRRPKGAPSLPTMSS